jgi:hypothetical protein
MTSRASTERPATLYLYLKLNPCGEFILFRFFCLGGALRNKYSRDFCFFSSRKRRCEHGAKSKELPLSHPLALTAKMYLLHAKHIREHLSGTKALVPPDGR